MIREWRRFPVCAFFAATMFVRCGAAQEHQRVNPETQAPIRFENTLAQSGILFRLDNSASAHKFQVETMAGGVAMFDYNNDGLLDLYFTNGASLPSMLKTDPKFYNRLYRNNGDGTFTDVTLSAGVQGSFYSIGAAAADYDNDGFEDLFVAGANGFQLFHNNGDGTFTDVTEKAGLRKTHPQLTKGFAAAAGWFDYDNDGFLDLIVINYLQWSPQTDVSCTVKNIRTYCSPDSYPGLANLLFHNNGDGTFTDVSEMSGIMAHIGKGMSVAFADYDGDGFTDVFISNDTFRNFLFRNNRNGTFTEVGVLGGVAYNEDGKSIAGMGSDFRDVDNDGKPDIFETAMSGDTFPLYHNLGNGTFEDVDIASHLKPLTTRLTGWGTGICDFDNDGWKDVFTSNAAILDNQEAVNDMPYRLPNALFHNNHDGTFSDAGAQAGKDFTVPGAHRGAAFGDLNNDGRIDIVTTSINGAPEILLNRTTNSNHWITLSLVGTKSNRDGLGALVTVTAGTLVEYNQATTSVGYASSSDKRVHFGIGSNQVIDSIEIRWPSGIRQRLTHVLPDRILSVVEPAT